MVPFIPLIAAVLSVGIPVSFAPDIAKAFDGEVLVAPPPPNWSGGTPVETDTGVTQIWRRTIDTDSDSTERIVVQALQRADNSVAATTARAAAEKVEHACTAPMYSDVNESRIEGTAVASLTMTCLSGGNLPEGHSRFSRVTAMIGEFRTYTISRTWIGRANDPAGPTQSPKVALTWERYFSRINICNTLTDRCDAIEAATIHAHPRFKNMRSLPVSVRPVLPTADVQKAAAAFGELTGRAEACGEQIGPLMLRVPRMFEYVSSNDKDSGDALAIFEDAREIAIADQQKRDKQGCGELRREFRAHPSRVQGFPKFVTRLLRG